jgi:hypothetical protein
MTCGHVLGLIDAGPFAGYPPEHIAAALEHARTCPACAPALAASTALAVELSERPQIAAPPDLEKTVMARIARLEDQPAVRAAASHAWTAWAVMAGAMAAATAFAIVVAIARNILTVKPDVVLVLLTVSLLIYIAGLFAPLTTRESPREGRLDL